VNIPRVLFRADASHGMGFGHVARLCALIEEIGDRGAEPVSLFGGDAALRAWATSHGLHAQIGEWSTTHVIQLAEAQRVSAVVIDGPALAIELAPRLAERRIHTVVVDDRGGCALKVAAIVNHNIQADQLAGTYPNAKALLLGRRYLMLRREIRRHTRGSCRPMSSARLRVIVTFGGSDPVDATSRVIDLVPADRPLELVVIAGPGYQHETALRAAAARAKDRGHDVDIRRSPDDPGALFVSADAAICSAGGTLGELAYLGCPALAYAIVPDQVAPARYQVRGGLIAGGRTWADTEDDLIRADLAAFLLDDAGRATQRQRALATADSDGPRRVIDEAL
jgi:spore coat polysaccharide biosynthesis predicted glycosyltransferase SpsG